MKTYRIRMQNQVYEVTVAALDTNPISVTVDGEAFEVWVENGQLDARVASGPAAIAPTISKRQSSEQGFRDPVVPPTQAGPSSRESHQVIAPIPGVITDVYVQPGQVVRPGDLLCSLEAMKMKNTIRAARHGTIDAINISLGQHVQHQQVLMVFDRQES